MHRSIAPPPRALARFAAARTHCAAFRNAFASPGASAASADAAGARTVSFLCCHVGRGVLRVRHPASGGDHASWRQPAARPCDGHWRLVLGRQDWLLVRSLGVGREVRVVATIDSWPRRFVSSGDRTLQTTGWKMHDRLSPSARKPASRSSTRRRCTAMAFRRNTQVLLYAPLVQHGSRWLRNLRLCRGA